MTIKEERLDEIIEIYRKKHINILDNHPYNSDYTEQEWLDYHLFWLLMELKTRRKALDDISNIIYTYDNGLV